MVELEECVPKCLATIPREQICSNLKEEIDINVKVTFWSYLAVSNYNLMIFFVDNFTCKRNMFGINVSILIVDNRELNTLK